MGLAEVRKRLEAVKRVPLNIVVVETGVTVPGILVAVMAADLDALEADLELMANVVEAAQFVRHASDCGSSLMGTSRFGRSPR